MPFSRPVLIQCAVSAFLLHGQAMQAAHVQSAGANSSIFYMLKMFSKGMFSRYDEIFSNCWTW
jgi:hypothetical protein